MNVSGARRNLEEVVQFMDEQELGFLALGETWLKPIDILIYPIMFDSRYPSRDPSKGRVIYDVMEVRNVKLSESNDFGEEKRDQEYHYYPSFGSYGTVFGGFCLPLSMEPVTCIECVLSDEDIVIALGGRK